MTHDTNIPQGYKATALGIIPQEWEVMRLGDIVSITSGESPSLYHLKAKGKYPYVKVEDLNNCEKYQESSREYSDDNNTTIKAGSIIFPKRGASILNNKVRIAAKDIQMDSNMMAITPHTAIVDTEFLYIRILHERLYRIADTSSIPQINNKHIIPYKIAVPPLAEQRKIAEVLGVWDEAIEKQARLIEKLALRKRGLMQRLLSAKLRLPGFSEPWKKVNYSDILKEVRRTLTWDENELYDLISVRRRSGGVFHRESLYGHEIKTKTLRPALEGDFLISKMQIVHGASGVVPKQLSGMKISGSYIALIAKDPKELNINYFNLWSQMPLFYHQTFVSSYGVHIEKMTFDLDAFMSLSMNLPPIEEQNKIVEVISTATNEIELAKEKLERLRRQKRGLMQQLLTGKKRVKY